MYCNFIGGKVKDVFIQSIIKPANSLAYTVVLIIYKLMSPCTSDRVARLIQRRLIRHD